MGYLLKTPIAESAVQQRLQERCSIKLSYIAVHQLACYRLNASVPGSD